jgi:hypothetical protein
MKQIGFLISVLLFVGLIKMNAQIKRVHAHQNSTWMAYIGNFKFSNKLSLHTELQYRRNRFLQNAQQTLTRVGVQYQPKDNFFFIAGYCFAYTSAYGKQAPKAAFPENRLWQQFQIKFPLAKAEWVTRLRLEQRFSKLPVLNSNNIYEPGDAIYTNRVRLMERVAMPFKGNNIAPNIWYGILQNEIFVNFGKKVGQNIFDQNRLFAGFGYRFNKMVRAEFGYMNHAILKSDGIKMEHNHTAVLNIITNINLVGK